MSEFDIMPWKNTNGATGFPRVNGRLTASSSFRAGEPVMLVNAGTISEFPADGTVPVVADMDGGRVGGIALTDGDTTRTRNAAVADQQITYAPFDRGVLFITRNFTDGSGAAVVPTGAMRGENMTLDWNSGTWSVATTAGTYGTDVVCVIHDVLDSTRTPIATSDTTTGVYVVFEIRTA